MIVADPQPWWVQPAVVAAAITFVGGVVALAVNGVRNRKDRQRERFADAFAAVADYWEFPYVVRRRRHDQPEAERVRISEALRSVQRDISFHQAWIRTECGLVADSYDDLVATTREVMGTQINEGWAQAPPTTDEEMNIPDIRRDGLARAQETYLHAVKDHLSIWPWWIGAPARAAFSRFRSGE